MSGEHYPGEVIWRRTVFVDDPAVLELSWTWERGVADLRARQPKGYGGGETIFRLGPDEVASLIGALQEMQELDPCAGLHLHYTGVDGENVWTAYEGPHALMGPGLFTAEHSAVSAWLRDRRAARESQEPPTDVN